MPHEISITRQVSNEQLAQAAQIFYEAFALKIHHLELFASTKDQALRILERSFRADCAWYALQDGVVLGVLGIERPNGDHLLQFSWKILLAEFGRLGALWRFAWIQFSQWFQRPRPGNLRIEAVAVSSSARGQGVGTLLIQHIFDLANREKYQGVVLEVVNTNPRAQKLYERLGFRKLRRDWVGLFTHSAGFSAVIYMRKELSSDAD